MEKQYKRCGELQRFRLQRDGSLLPECLWGMYARTRCASISGGSIREGRVPIPSALAGGLSDEGICQEEVRAEVCCEPGQELERRMPEGQA